MFRIRIYTPVATDESGWPHAGGELDVGTNRLHFLVDLRAWAAADYERQWRDGLQRLTSGAPSTALMTAFRGPTAELHEMWGLWRQDEYVYVQEHTVLPRELESPFDPANPYPHLGDWVPASDQNLPLAEWRVEIVHLFAAALGIRWPLLP